MAKTSTPDTKRAALAVHETICLLHALQWAARAGEDDGFDGMTSALQLVLTALPRAGSTLEAAYAALDGSTRVGYFPLQPEMPAAVA